MQRALDQIERVLGRVHRCFLPLGHQKTRHAAGSGWGGGRWRYRLGNPAGRPNGAIGSAYAALIRVKVRSSSLIRASATTTSSLEVIAPPPSSRFEMPVNPR